MERTLSAEALKHIGKTIKLSGWVQNRRDHGKIIFIDLRDRSGIIQAVFTPQSEKTYKSVQDLRPEWVISIEGIVKDRPEKMINPKIETGKIEIQAENLEIISKLDNEFPFDLNKELNVKLDTLLNNRPLTLRHERNKAIFNVYQTVFQAYQEIMKKLGFFEIKSPKIIGTASESGANVFNVDYFGKKAFLAQSPQFYKQIGVGVFERVFEIGPVFRAEKHFTTRHINEYISLDAEMGFIESHEDLMAELTKALKFIFQSVKEKNKKELEMFGAKTPEIGEKIPAVKLSEIKKIIKEKYDYEIPEDTDIDPKGEEFAGRYAKEEFNSDFIFLTHYPVQFRPFYAMPDESTKLKETKSFDLLFRGLEIVTGGQRIHNYKQLVKNIKKWKLSPKTFGFYLQTFKYGMPPHGGWGIGSERIAYKLLGLSTIKEAVLFPRDVKRLTP